MKGSGGNTVGWTPQPELSCGLVVRWKCGGDARYSALGSLETSSLEMSICESSAHSQYFRSQPGH